MRHAVFVVAACLLAGCTDGVALPRELDVTEASNGGPAPWDGRSLGYARDVDCPAGAVHRIQVEAAGLAEADAGASRWSFTWDDKHRAGVMYADVLQGGSADSLRVNLGGCPPDGVERVILVELMAADGQTVGRSAVD